MVRPDPLILSFDRFLRTVAAPAGPPRRRLSLPPLIEGQMGEAQRRHAAALMRVNHAGEIAAQALYDGQAVFARNAHLKATLYRAAEEERDHLAWTEQRLCELGSRPSRLAPLWYAGAFVIGAATAALGDKISASFLKATEKQVEAHLSGHLESLPATDVRSRAIVEAMRVDEAAHAQTAVAMGAQELPKPAQWMMKAAAKVMTTLAYRI